MTVAAPLPVLDWRAAYRMRWKRRRLLWRSFRARHQLNSVADRTATIAPDDILAFVVLRNEAMRLPYFLDYYRNLGVTHFLVVDNDSTDGSSELLTDHPDISLWQTGASYRDSRFGVDWLTFLMMRYGHGHWCLTVDVDELLVYGGIQSRDLRDLTNHLTQLGQSGFGALMLDLFPRGRVNDQRYEPGQDPCAVLNWFDPGPYRAVRQSPMGNLWLQGGTRDRVFFGDRPMRAPTLNKIPLIHWDRRYSYVNSTHSALPPRLNAVYDGPAGTQPSGVLLHSKFLPDIVARSETEKQRKQHFGDPDAFAGYYDQLMDAPDLWHSKAVQYQGPDQLVALGLMRGPDWATQAQRSK